MLAAAALTGIASAKVVTFQVSDNFQSISNRYLHP